MVVIPERFQQAVREQQVEYIYRTIPGQLIANPSVAICVLWLFQDIHPPALLFEWGLLLLVVMGVKFWVSRSYWRARRTSSTDNTDWGRLYTLTNIINGLVWGYAFYVFYSPQHYLESSVLIVMIAGSVAGTFGSHSAYYPSFAAFASTSIGMTIFRLLLVGGGAELILAVLSVIYYVIMMFYARTALDHVRQAIVMRLQVEELNRELVSQREELIAAKEEAEIANLAKSRFLASASHDLRQPLHALRLFVDILEQRASEPAVRQVVKKILTTTDALEGLFSNLLELARMDARIVEPCYETVGLHQLMEAIYVESEPSATEKALSLRMRCKDVQVHTDRAILSRIIRNFVTNAIRYTKDGGVLIGCRVRNENIRIEVWDTGIGIASEELPQIFEEFHQLHNPERDRTQGLGLGLAIAERLAALLDVKIKVRSRKHYGSCFSIEIPLAHAEKERGMHAPLILDNTSTIDTLRVVFIEDDMNIRSAMGELFEEWGCGYALAENFEMLQQQTKLWNAAPDVIITDYRLREGVLGTQLIRQLRDYYGKPLPAIIVTGDTSPERLKDAADSGSCVLHKPIKAARLRVLIEQLVSDGRAESA